MLSRIPAVVAVIFVLCNASPPRQCMPVSQLESRIGEWVGKVPYSHKLNRTWGVPTDCSGFVSWALNMTLRKAYEWGSTDSTTEIESKDLRFGDMLPSLRCLVQVPAWCCTAALLHCCIAARYVSHCR